MRSFSDLLSGVRRGFARRCPHCGVGKAFTGYLKVAPCCTNCGMDLQQFPADDAPPYVTILIVGHILVPLALVVDRDWPLAEPVQIAIWCVMAGCSTLTLLPYVKGAVIGFEWGVGIIRQDGPSELAPAERSNR